MDETTPKEIAVAFLAGGGEMGAQMRAKDWSQTPLGEPHTWPQSLKTAIRIMLTSRYAMWMAWGPDLTFFCNDAYKPTLGIKGDWALGSRSDKVWEEIWKDIGPRIQRVFDTGVATWDEGLLLFLKRSGYAEETYHTFSYSPLPGDDDSVAGMLCVVTEETERVISDRRLVSLNRLSSSLSQAKTEPEVYAIVERWLRESRHDLPFGLLYVFDEKQKIARLTSRSGFSENHPLAPPTIEDGDGLWRLSEFLDRSVPIRISLEEQLEGCPTGAWDIPPREAVAVRIAGETVDQAAGILIAGINPYRPFDEAYSGFVDLVVAQVSGSLATVRGFEQARKRAEALAAIDRAKTAFFSNVSHEFRTPLTLMMSPIEEVLSKPNTTTLGDSRVLIEVAHRNSLRLLKLVNTLLDFSRIEAGRVQARYKPHDLSEWTTELASNFRSAIERAGLRFLIDCPPLAEPVYVDRDMWEKIVLNLISNAFKFTFDGEIEVSQRISEDGRNVEFAVRDTGTGIPREELPRLFERFHRVEGAKGRSYEGSGIGLALVQELVRLHGGSISVDSQIDVGSRFVVSIPRGSAHLPQDRVGAATPMTSTALRPDTFVQEALRWGGPADQLVSDAAAQREVADLVVGESRSRLLVADDNADMREYIHRLLSPYFDVEVLPDGEAALAAARSNAPAIVLSDVMMPRLDGFGLIKAFRADPLLRQVPIILLSARAGDEAKVEGFEAGADDYLVKPFSARELVARVQANLEAARIRKEGQDRLQQRTTELETVLETVPTAVWFTHDADARYVAGNQYAARLLRMAAGSNFSLSAPKSERPSFRAFRDGVELPSDSLPIQRAARGEEVPDEQLEIRFEDARSITILIRARPIKDAAGVVRGAVCAALDITERAKAEEQRAVLVNELNHRVKNTLATVQSLAAQTMRNTKIEDVRKLFDSRLGSLSRAHDVLTRESWIGANLDEIVSRALEPFRFEGRLNVRGPQVRLTPKQALGFSMALHELATNATKYGALSNANGVIDITWSVLAIKDFDEIQLIWGERGGPTVSPPSRKGFGSRLIEKGLALDLGGICRIDYRPEGVVAVLRSRSQSVEAYQDLRGAAGS